MCCDCTGAFGIDFSSLKEDNVSESISLVSEGLLRYGVTAYVPTIVTSSTDYYKRMLPLICPRAGGKHGAAVLGTVEYCVLRVVITVYVQSDRAF